MIHYCSQADDFLYALKELKDGDTILLSDGEYIFDKTIEVCQSEITITAKNCAVLNFKNVPYVCEGEYDNTNIDWYRRNGNGLNIYGSKCRVSNIHICFAAFRGLENYGSFSTFENIETSYCCDCGHSQVGCDNIVKVCVSHHNFDYRLIRRGQPMHGFNSDGFADKMHCGNGNKYICCESYYNGDDGFDFFQRETEEDSPTKIIGCVARNNGGIIDLSKNERLKEDMEYNRKDMLWVSDGGGNGFKFGGVHHTTRQKEPSYVNRHHVMIQDSLAYDNVRDGFTQNGTQGEVRLGGCSSKGNGNLDYAFLNMEGHIKMRGCWSALAGRSRKNSVLIEDVNNNIAWK